jgi:hypothetical protein
LSPTSFIREWIRQHGNMDFPSADNAEAAAATMHHFHIVEPLGQAQFLDGWRAANAMVDRRHASLLQAPYQDIYQAPQQAPYEAPQQVAAAAEARVEGEGEGEGAEQPPPNPAPPLDPLPPDVGPQQRRGRNARRNRNRRLPRRPMQDSDDPPNALLHYLDGALDLGGLFFSRKNGLWLMVEACANVCMVWGAGKLSPRGRAFLLQALYLVLLGGIVFAAAAAGLSQQRT